MTAYAETIHSDEGTLILFSGYEEDDLGDRSAEIVFAVERRYALAILEIIAEDDGEPLAVFLEDWQIVSRINLPQVEDIAHDPAQMTLDV